LLRVFAEYYPGGVHARLLGKLLQGDADALVAAGYLQTRGRELASPPIVYREGASADAYAFLTEPQFVVLVGPSLRWASVLQVRLQVEARTPYLELPAWVQAPSAQE
jgi:hypothetical protein